MPRREDRQTGANEVIHEAFSSATMPSWETREMACLVLDEVFLTQLRESEK